ncbi:MAG: hypothetical protein IPJ90_17725 [Anaerolineaceae bacterium]|nr:hypothetical protein [Anaerolineaceae bacterium]
MFKSKSSTGILISITMLALIISQVFSQASPSGTQTGQSLDVVNGINVVTFVDGAFNTGWTDVSGVTDDPLVSGVGPGTSSFDGSSTQNNGGNPNAYRETTHTVVNGDRIYTGGLNSFAVYTPSDSGAITSIDFASDLLHPDSGSTGWFLLLKQNGVLYFAGRGQAFGNSTWQSFTLDALTEEDFDTSAPGLAPNNVHPDFSTNGASITFGYVMTNSSPGTNQLTHGIDNWSVTINTSPFQIFLPVILR